MSIPLPVLLPNNSRLPNRFPRFLGCPDKKAAPDGGGRSNASRVRYGRLGACDGGGVKPGTVRGAAGDVACGGVALFDATRLGSCPTPKAKARTMTRNTAPAIRPQLVLVRSAGSYPLFPNIGSFG